MAERVFVHVGTPKSGTSFAQQRLFTNPEALAAQGVLYPGDRFDAHFLAALDLIGVGWGGLEEEAVGHWDALAEQVRAHPGTAIVSHEILAYATPEQVERAMASLGAGDGTEIHVVLSARDLARQIPAEWQENVKHRRRLRYAEYLDCLRDPARETLSGQWFWGVQEVPSILQRWGAGLSPERVHVVTVPRPGAEPDTLWLRIMAALDVDPTDFRIEAERANPSLGVPEAALLRRLNEELRHRFPNHDYREFVREFLVHRNLSRRTGSARLALPAEVHAWTVDLATDWVRQVETAGYAVVGDLAELLPADPLPFTDPDTLPEAELNAVAVESMRILLEEVARLRHSERHLEGRVADLERELGVVTSAPGYRAKRRVVERAEHSAAGRAGLRVYRALLRRG